MPSRFLPQGHTRRDPEDAPGWRHYVDKLRNWGVDDNFLDDDHLRGKLYADAMLTQDVQLLLDRAKAELHPLSTQTFLELHEQQLGAVPLEGDSLKTRRERVYAYGRLLLDGRVSSIDATLRQFLGSLYAFYRTTRVNELTSFDKSPQNRTDFNHVGRQTPIRAMRATVGVVRLGVQLTVPTEFLGGVTDPYSVGQVVLFDAGRNDRTERVTVLGCTDTTITAVFSKPHDAGAFVTSGHQPRYPSAKRMHHIVVKDDGALNPSTRGTVNELMRRLVKGTATWQVLQETDPSTAGPFILDESPMDATPFAEVQS